MINFSTHPRYNGGKLTWDRCKCCGKNRTESDFYKMLPHEVKRDPVIASHRNGRQFICKNCLLDSVHKYGWLFHASDWYEFLELNPSTFRDYMMRFGVNPRTIGGEELLSWRPERYDIKATSKKAMPKIKLDDWRCSPSDLTKVIGLPCSITAMLALQCTHLAHRLPAEAIKNGFLAPSWYKSSILTFNDVMSVVAQLGTPALTNGFAFLNDVMSKAE